MNDLGGYDFEDLAPGMSATFAKTITEADIVMFAGVSGITMPFTSMRNSPRARFSKAALRTACCRPA
jgi:hypothetical protein